MSFEFYGGVLAHSLLHKDLSAPTVQAEAVTEAIIRHQDIGTSGKITTLGQLIQLATIFGMRMILSSRYNELDKANVIQTTWVGIQK